MANMSMKRFESAENQKRLRNALIDWSRSNPVSEAELAIKIGVSHSTLRRFWKAMRDVDYKTLCFFNLFLEKEKGVQLVEVEVVKVVGEVKNEI